MKLFSSVFLIITLLSSSFIFGQEYQSPLNFRLLLSGTFGELRDNHFHAGIDIKTEGVKGQKVYAIERGYVARIKISSWGYGKAIYINHPDGRTSVYAHLQKFSAKIDSLVKKEHYKKESFEINFYPNKDALLINQGEVIALSGNSGGSSGAHLHFEIRDTKSEHPINPLQFGFKITDNIAPTLKKLKIYALDSTLINGYRKSKIITILKNENDEYSINEKVTINGAFGLGIFTYDKLNDSYNKNGVYSIKLCVDSTICYQFKVDELDFSTSRYINAHIDYCEKQESKQKYHRCYKLPHNKLNNYSNLINDGIISVKDTLTHLICLEVTDIYANVSVLNFKIKSNNNSLLNIRSLPEDSTSIPFSFNKVNIFKKENIELKMQAFSLYEPLQFRYNTTDSIDEVFGLVHHVHNNTVPVHKKYTLSIKANVADNLKNKTYIATTDMKGSFWYLGGKWQDGFLRTKVREFGDFCIIADTIKPEIKGVNIFPGKVFNTQTTIKLTIKDKHSGIKSYRGEIDGKWILMDYDYKRNLLRFDIGKNISKGKHNFTLKVIDNVENTTEYKAKFTY